jgi:threonine/homoserine/homoserine lactone efflux protein
LEGAQAGLVLALLVGPLLVFLLQLSLRQGTLAAFAGAFGIWTSDASLAAATHFGLGGLNTVADSVYLTNIIGTVGGAILLVIAIITWFRDPIDLEAEREAPSNSGLLSAFAQGFAINTFNPFTISFWSFFSVTQVHDRGLTDEAALAIYAGLILTIVFTDVLKVLTARKLRAFLTPVMMRRAQRFGALVLAIFGVVLAVRVWLA